jgi:LytS/YehU family sensor histidine kinase
MFINFFSILADNGKRKKQISNLSYELKEKVLNSYFVQFEHHYLFNSLITLRELINSDKKGIANSYINDFMICLRQCLNLIDSNKMITIQEEVEFIKTYVNLERVRYTKKINLICDIEDGTQHIPAMIMQPIVENSLKHGFDENRDSLNIFIKTTKDNKNNVIIISDDGEGFDIEENMDTTKHKGINNIRQRVELLTKGEIYIETSLGIGTTTNIIIPIQKDI